MESRAQDVLPSTEIIPLALPKGTEKLCELCQKRAYLQCGRCRVTYYCDADHQQSDWIGIHKRICQLLIPIRTPSLFSMQRAGRIENLLKTKELIEICRLVAESKLSEGKHQEAVPAAQACLRCSTDVYGPNTVQLVPAYLLLADANMGMNNLALVAELLSQAEWAVLKSPECGYAVHHRLHRSMGCLHTATGHFEAALFHFANDVRVVTSKLCRCVLSTFSHEAFWRIYFQIYFASEEYGLDSTVICGAYFLMAAVFVKLGEPAIVHSLYTEVAETWHSHLTKLLQSHIQNMQKNPDMLEPSFDEGQKVEVGKMLRSILAFEQDETRKEPGIEALVAHALAMLSFLGGDAVKALEFGQMALEASQLIQNHDLTETIRALLQLLGKDPQLTSV
ncbi:zinc finger MYND domain-containing protein 12 isoform X1 [Syngnathus typhle]|uniref:zinc finger MYND domain-containing protein 12 isoform X1 n=1 Tax=Syngnathus typhle TaxID=161592 RepID=UPI002A69EDE0|nr:zinc finger MYND domain-containing protein 12 isoform X1 [Syngnathus typhle]